MKNSTGGHREIIKEHIKSTEWDAQRPLFVVQSQTIYRETSRELHATQSQFQLDKKDKSAVQMERFAVFLCIRSQVKYRRGSVIAYWYL